MKTVIDVRMDPMSENYAVVVKRTDGAVLSLPCATVERTADVARFLIEAFSQETIATLEESHVRVMKVFDKASG